MPAPLSPARLPGGARRAAFGAVVGAVVGRAPGAVALAVLLAVTCASYGCTRSYALVEPTDAGPGTDGARRRDGGPRADSGSDPTCAGSGRVDLLFVIDDSNSMAEEQASLAEQLPDLVRTLADPPDRDRDGAPDWYPVRDLHVGVVSTDMGTGGHRVPTCEEPNFGDDGVLSSTGSPWIEGCASTYPTFLSYAPGTGDPDALARDLACVATLGTGGCGFEQQLEATLKALTPSTAPIFFGMGTAGHADRANAGFARADAAMGIVLLTDEDDCSVTDPELFDPTSSTYLGDLNLRCFSYPAAVHLVDRYVDGLLRLRPDRPERLALLLIAGVPVELTGDPAQPDYERILDDPLMQEQIDPELPIRLRPSCRVAGRGLAFPPRRLVRLAQALDERGATPSVVGSICQADYRAQLVAFAERLGRRACAP